MNIKSEAGREKREDMSVGKNEQERMRRACRSYKQGTIPSIYRFAKIFSFKTLHEIVHFLKKLLAHHHLHVLMRVHELLLTYVDTILI